jgi:hypothetical protein
MINIVLYLIQAFRTQADNGLGVDSPSRSVPTVR